MGERDGGWIDALTHVPERVDVTAFWARVAVLAGLALWSISLVRMDYRTGEMAQAFLHRPLLVFHEAGHVVFMAFGEWIAVLGGTLGQLLVPLIITGAFLVRNHDPFGASVGLWFLGVSVLDVSPYMFDALEPRLMLLGGRTGEDGGPHDWIYLFDSLGLIRRAPVIAGLVHAVGALLVMLALAWSAWLLWRQHGHIAGDVLHED